MATLFWRHDRNRWYCYFGSASARRCTPLVTAPRREALTRRERVAAREEAERIADNHRAVPVAEIDLETATAYWLDDVRQTRGVRTWERYRTVGAAFGRATAGAQRMPLSAVTSQHVRAFRDARMQDHATSTVRNDLKAVSALFAWCRRQRVGGVRWIAENPCEDVEPPKRVARVVPFPTTADVRRLLDLVATEPPEIRGLAILGALAGMRRSEILLLRWDRVDLERNVLLVSGKSKRDRPIPLHPQARAFLASLTPSGPLVFPSPYTERGQARSPMAARVFNRLLSAHGFPFTHHALRRWFNDQLRQTTLTDEARLLVVGHEDRETNRLYSNPSTEEARPFVAALLSPRGSAPHG